MHQLLLHIPPQYPFETLFRSQHFALLDNGCREYLFLSDFFMVAGNSALDLFNCIMGKTLGMFLVRSVHLCGRVQRLKYICGMFRNMHRSLKG